MNSNGTEASEERFECTRTITLSYKFYLSYINSLDEHKGTSRLPRRIMLALIKTSFLPIHRRSVGSDPLGRSQIRYRCFDRSTAVDEYQRCC
jgi:hypothetical protein